MKKYLLILATIFINCSVLAQVPNTISWQGIIQDNSGNNLNGNYNITVKLFDVVTGGTAVWTEIHNSIAITDGLANLSLGSVTPFNLNFDKQYWLEITVESGTPLSRIKLASVPYSIYSAKSSGVIVNDSLVLKDAQGVTRMVLNPNTGTFKMMNNDTVWYELNVNSPLEEKTVLQNGSYIRKSGNNIWEYNSEHSLIYSKDVSDDGQLTIESYFDNGDIHYVRVTSENENSKSVTDESFVQEASEIRIYSDATTTFKYPTEVEGVENVVSRSANYNYISGFTSPAKTTQVYGKTVNGEFSEQYSDDGVKLNRKITSSVENKTITTEISYNGNNTTTTNTIEFHNEIATIRKEVKYYENDILKELTEYYPNGEHKTYRYNNDGSLHSSGLFSSDGKLICAWDGNNSGINYDFSPDGFKFSRYYPTPGTPKGYIGPTWDNNGFQVGYQTYNGFDRGNIVVGYNNVSVYAGSNTGIIQLNSNTTVTGNNTVNGNQTIGGDLNVTGPKKFRITHPTDNTKYLQHAAIESNEVLNKYSGTITTGSDGFATITLPSYFDDVNTDFRYNLTVISTSFVQAIIYSEIDSNNQFKIKTSEPNTKVSWEVTAKRNDAYLQDNPFQDIINK